MGDIHGGVKPEVGSLETGGAGLANVEDVLEVLIEGVEKAVTESPEEEQGGDEGNGPNGLADGQFGGPGEAGIGDLERPVLEELLDAHDEGWRRARGNGERGLSWGNARDERRSDLPCRRGIILSKEQRPSRSRGQKGGRRSVYERKLRAEDAHIHGLKQHCRWILGLKGGQQARL